MGQIYVHTFLHCSSFYEFLLKSWMSIVYDASLIDIDLGWKKGDFVINQEDNAVFIKTYNLKDYGYWEEYTLSALP